MMFNYSLTMNQNHVIDVYVNSTMLQLTVEATTGGTTDPAYGIHTYSYGSTANITAAPAPGHLFSHWIIGDGTNQSSTISLTMTENLTITPVFTVDPDYVPPTHNVSFTQTGLAAGTSWNVTFNGVTQSSTTDTIIFTGYADGTYDYSIATPDGYTSTATLTGTLTVNGENSAQTITFTQLQTIVFTVSNLPSGAEWSVTLGDVTKNFNL